MLGCTLDEAQDLAQTTLLRCYTAWRKIQRAENRDAYVYTYVYKVLLNCHRDSRRRRWWGERPTNALPDHGTPDATGDLDTADALRRASSDLSPVNREVVVLRYY